MTIFGTWGRPVPAELHDKVTSTWGARAIFTQNDFIDLLPDRQSWQIAGASRPEDWTPEQKATLSRLSQWLNKTGLPWLRKTAKKEFSSSSGESRTISYDDGTFHIEANPQGSYGYLYIGAWEVHAIEGRCGDCGQPLDVCECPKGLQHP